MNRFSVRTLSVSLLLLFLSHSVNCDPLTKDENENRLKTCGKAIQSKVYQGREAAQSEAPWSVFVNVLEGSSVTVCTGTVISPRHILTATHCFTTITNDGWDQIEDGGRVLTEKKGTNYVISAKEWLKKVTVKSNGKVIAERPERLTLISATSKRAIASGESPNQHYEDMALIDLYEDVVFSENVHAACVSQSVDENKEQTQLEIFGFGLNPKTLGPGTQTDNTGILRHEKMQVFTMNVKLEPFNFLAHDPNGTTITCSGDSGGGAVSKSNGKTTIVGVLSSTNCASPKRPILAELYSSVGHFSGQICQLSGVCESADYDKHHSEYVRQPKPIRTTEPPAVSQGNNGGSGTGETGQTIPDGSDSKDESGGQKDVANGAKIGGYLGRIPILLTFLLFL
ncbi:unnamed protein product [Caenorhabditis sp. 36 PRJEB53466]|nr:unnamed protein product [Caenorhabditis sp. 36 PRJEB53466]